MKNSIVILLTLLLLIISDGDGNALFGDSRTNILGTGFDILEYGLRESWFVLESIDYANPDERIRTKTLPNGVVMIDIPSNTFHLYSEVYDKNTNVETLRKVSVSGGGGYWKISGSFSIESQTAKKFISKINHKTTRVTSQSQIAELQLQTHRLNLTEGIRIFFHIIADALRKNTRNSLIVAQYNADRLIATYGTGFIDREIIGGSLGKTDAVDIASYDSSVDQKLSASAKVSFAKFFKMKGSYETEHSELEHYEKTVTDTLVNTIGGVAWKTNPNFTYDDWVDSLNIYPATIGVNVRYILDIVDNVFFPNMSDDDLFNIRQLLEQRLDVYYKNNYYKGCSNPSASNYVSYANVFDDKLCNYQQTFHFGGTFTTSNNPSFQVPNLLTLGYSCPTGFETKPILHQQFAGASHSVQHCTEQCTRHCHHSWFSKKCKTYCSPSCWTESWVDTIVTDTYICISIKNQTKGVYFGGMYTTQLPSDITMDKSCPYKYTAAPIFHDYAKSYITYICQATYDMGVITALPFGGIFSSQDPNYLVGNLPVCGDGFERHTLGPYSDLYYCIGIGSLDSNLKKIIPPGYGSTLNQLLDYYKIYDFKNGTFVGIRMDPNSLLSFEDQMEELIDKLQLPTETSHSDNNQIKMGLSAEHTSFLEQWAKYHTSEQGINENQDQSGNQNIQKGVNVTDIAVSVTVASLLVFLLSGMIFAKFFVKRKSQYEPIE